MSRKVSLIHIVRRLAEAGLLTPGVILDFLRTAIGQGVTIAALADRPSP